MSPLSKGEEVTTTLGGTPLAGERPVPQPKEPLSTRLGDLRRRNILTPARTARPLRTLAEKKGELQRFLDSRE